MKLILLLKYYDYLLSTYWNPILVQKIFLWKNSKKSKQLFLILLSFNFLIIFSYPYKHYSTKILKFIIFTALLLLNVFLILFTIFYCVARDISFQYKFVKMAALQLIIEIFVFGILESMILDVLIPNLVYDEVRKMSCSIEQLGCQVFENKGRDLKTDFFNPSDYFFVSKYVARATSHLFGMYFCIF